MSRRFEQRKESIVSLEAMSDAADFGNAPSLADLVSGKHRSEPLLSKLLPFLVVLLGVVTTMVIAWLSDAMLLGFFASFFLVTISVVFFVVLHAVKTRKVKSPDRDLLLSAIDTRSEAMAITDQEGALICANPAYGRLFDGFPSPRSVAGPVWTTCVDDIQQNGQVEVKLGPEQNIDVRITKSRYGKGYLVWEARQRDNEAQDSYDDHLALQGYEQWLNEQGVGWLVADQSGAVKRANAHIAALLSLSEKDMKGRDLTSLFDLDVLHGVAKPLIGEGATTLSYHADEVSLSTGKNAVAYFFEEQKDAGGATSEAMPEAMEGLPQQLFDDAPVGIAIVDEDGVLLRCNGPTKQILGGANCNGSTKLSDLVTPDHQDTIVDMQVKAVAGQADRKPLEIQFSHNPENVTQIFARSLKDGSGAVFYLIDTTEQKQLELQFTQAQKMQAVGQLAGGIAHDFNNILTAVIGFCDLLLVRHGAGDASFSDIMQIKQNSNRAANLVRQLLAFSRQQTLRPTVLTVTDVLAELSNLLRRLIGENIELKMTHGRDMGQIKVDQGQLEQVIINLAVNARDAMDGGGTLTIKTHKTTPEDVRAMGHKFMPEQEYVALIIEDTGHGIPKNFLSKIFEPFFTTKEVGKGTGLGLSTVYGIVKQTGGFIFADSEEGNGARFTIYLPVHQSKDEDHTDPVEKRAPDSVADLWGHGTILLVEDEAAVRTFAYRALTKKGYSVLEAGSGEAALDIVKGHEGDIDLVVSDVVMPNMDGPTLVKEIQKLRPDAKIIFISGYAQDSFRDGNGTTNHHFLPKPFSLSQLAEKVKSVLQEG